MIHSKYLQFYLSQKENINSADYLPTLEILEEEYINYIFELTGNDLKSTADILGISPSQLFKKLKKIEVWI